jgi:galactose mutarotase-like enzyme
VYAPATLRAGPWEAGLLAEQGGNFLCVEPVSYLPNLRNQGFAIDTLDAGETLALTMRITS